MRVQQEISPTAGSALIAGSIGDALRMHANERCVHFFMFLFAVDACCRRMKAVTGIDIAPWDVVSPKATHQVDMGFRLTNPVYYDFDERDPAVINRSASSCRNTDAAHFCNLGLVAGPWQQLALAANGDIQLFDMLEMAKRLAGNTRHLPQRINIGPDRIVDQAHGVLADRLLRLGKPVVSTPNISAYLQYCGDAMFAYGTAAFHAGALGLAACCEAYLKVYSLGPQPPYYTLSGYVWAECAARSNIFNRDDFLAD